MCIKCSSFLIFSSLFKNTIRGTSRAAKGYRELLLSPSHYGDTGQTWSHSNHLSPREIWSQNSGWFLLLMFVCFYLTRLPTIRFFLPDIFLWLICTTTNNHSQCFYIHRRLMLYNVLTSIRALASSYLLSVSFLWHIFWSSVYVKFLLPNGASKRCIFSPFQLHFPMGSTTLHASVFVFSRANMLSSFHDIIVTADKRSWKELHITLSLLQSWLTDENFNDVEKVGCLKSRAKLSWATFGSLNSPELSSTGCDLTSLELFGKIFAMCKQDF